MEQPEARMQEWRIIWQDRWDNDGCKARAGSDLQPQHAAILADHAPQRSCYHATSTERRRDSSAIERCATGRFKGDGGHPAQVHCQRAAARGGCGCCGRTCARWGKHSLKGEGRRPVLGQEASRQAKHDKSKVFLKFAIHHPACKQQLSLQIAQGSSGTALEQNAWALAV
jgi:hypothetical protein